MNSLLQQARKRAQSRAAVLNSLHETYGKEKKSQGSNNGPSNGSSKFSNKPLTPSNSSGKTQSRNDQGSTSSKTLNSTNTTAISSINLTSSTKTTANVGEERVGATSNKAQTEAINAAHAEQTTTKATLSTCVEVLVNNILDVQSDRNREFFKEAFNNKALILENSGAQKHAAGARARLKRKQQGQGSLSKRQQKKAKLLDYHTRPSDATLLLLHQNWMDYMRKVVQSSGSVAQLQARCMQSELIGAAVIILDHHNHSGGGLCGVQGIVTHHNTSHFYLAHSLYTPSTPADNNKTKKRKRKVWDKEVLMCRGVIKVEREEVVLAVILPTTQSLTGWRDSSNSNSNNNSSEHSDDIVDGKEEEEEEEVCSSVWQRLFSTTGLLANNQGKIVIFTGKCFQPFLASSSS